MGLQWSSMAPVVPCRLVRLPKAAVCALLGSIEPTSSLSCHRALDLRQDHLQVR